MGWRKGQHTPQHLALLGELELLLHRQGAWHSTCQTEVTNPWLPMRIPMRIPVAFCSVLALSLAAQTPLVFSTQKERKDLRLTLYQNGKAFIQDTRSVVVPSGASVLRVFDLSADIAPESFQVRTLDGGDPLGIRRQSYLLSRPTSQQVLSLREGKSVRVASSRNGKEVIEDATLVSAEGETLVLKFADRVEVLGASSPRRIIVSELPNETPPTPRMDVAIETGARGARSVLLAYVSSGFSWTPAYAVVIQPGEDRIDLTAWASIVNFTRTPVEGARIDLLAGDVPAIPDARNSTMNFSFAPGVKFDKAPPPPPPPPPGFMESWMPAAISAGDRKVYTLPDKYDLLPNQLIQVPFLEAREVKVRKEYRLTRNLFWDEDEAPAGEGEQLPIVAALLFKNEESQHLGRQLPAGTVRQYQADEKGILRFLGEDQIAESAAGMEVRLALGTVTDLTARCKMTDHTVKEEAAPRRSEEERAYEILFTNRKDAAQVIHTQIEIPGEWTLLSSTLPGSKEQAHTLGFQVQVPAKGQTKLQFRVRTRSGR